MHRYLQAAGFSEKTTDNEIYRFICDNVLSANCRTHEMALEDGASLKEYRLPVNDCAGICAAVISLDSGENILQYYYPYLESAEVSLENVCTIERHTSQETFEGIIEEYKPGLSLIFYVSNPVDYRMMPDAGRIFDFYGTNLSAFADSATVLLPVEKSSEDLEASINLQKEQDTLIEAARNGDEEAIDTLTKSDMDMFEELAQRIENEDLYSIVEQSLLPCGVECDQYTIVGEILSIRDNINIFTGTELYIMKVQCNELEFRLCMRKQDLVGEPLKGRRIKCRIWMQGRVNFNRPRA